MSGAGVKKNDVRVVASSPVTGEDGRRYDRVVLVEFSRDRNGNRRAIARGTGFPGGLRSGDHVVVSRQTSGLEDDARARGMRPASATAAVALMAAAEWVEGASLRLERLIAAGDWDPTRGGRPSAVALDLAGWSRIRDRGDAHVLAVGVSWQVAREGDPTA